MDISQIKNRLNQLQNQSSTSENFWKPDPGTQVVRIVPYKHNKDNPFIELYFHYNLGNNKTYYHQFHLVVQIQFKSLPINLNPQVIKMSGFKVKDLNLK